MKKFRSSGTKKKHFKLGKKLSCFIKDTWVSSISKWKQLILIHQWNENKNYDAVPLEPTTQNSNWQYLIWRTHRNGIPILLMWVLNGTLGMMEILSLLMVIIKPSSDIYMKSFDTTIYKYHNKPNFLKIVIYFLKYFL